MATNDVLTLSKEEVRAMTESEFNQAIHERAKLAVDNSGLEQKEDLQFRDANLLEQVQVAKKDAQELFDSNDLEAYEVAMKELNELKDTHRVVQERLNVYLNDGVYLYEVDYTIINELVELVRFYYRPKIKEKENEIRAKLNELTMLHDDLYQLKSSQRSRERSIHTIAHLNSPSDAPRNYPSVLVELMNYWK